MGRNAGFDQVERAVKSLLKKLVVRLFSEFLSHHRRLPALGENAEIDQSDRIAVFVLLGAEHAADGDGQ